MAENQWLVVPAKFTEPIDIGSIFASHILSSYGKKTTASMDDVCRQLTQLRRDAVAAMDKPSEGTLKHVTSYLAQINHARKRFDLSKFKLSFLWSDALDSKKRITDDRLDYEEACILYNIASFHSVIAYKIDTDNEAGAKAAAGNYQVSAGILSYLREKVIPKFDSTRLTKPLGMDFSESGIEMMMQITLAQAQACVFINAVLRNMAPSSIAMLAKQASIMFKNAADYAEKVRVIVPPLVICHLRFQSSRFTGSAHYFQSKSYIKQQTEEAKGYGMEIAHLNAAVVHLQDALRLHSSTAPGSGGGGRIVAILPALVQQLLDQALLLQKAKSKENMLVYSEAVPAITELDPIKPYPVAKPTVFAIDDLGKVDLFAALESAVAEDSSSSCSIM